MYDHSISPEALVQFRKYFTLLTNSILWCAEWRFHTPCFKVKVIERGQRSHVQTLCQLHVSLAPARIQKMFYSYAHFNKSTYRAMFQSPHYKVNSIGGIQKSHIHNWYIVGRQSKPHNSDFYQNVFCQCRNTKRMAHILSNSCSSRPIRTPLKSINHASKYCIYERYHFFSANFTEIRCFAM